MSENHSDSPVLLVQAAPRDLFRTGRSISNLVNLMPPLGLLSIASYLDERGYDVQIFDFNAHPGALPLLRDVIARRRPRWLGISCVTSTFKGALMIARAAKEASPHLNVVLGGPHVSALKESVLADNQDIDMVVVGEGEETFFRLVSEGPEAASGIEGLAFRSAGGRPQFTGYRSEPVELDELPFPAYNSLRGFPQRYRTTLFNYPRTPSASIISSRGCPYSCSYCDRSVFRRSFRYNSAGYLYGHMEFLRGRHGVRHLTFYDDQFTFNRERVAGLCEMLISRPLGMTFNCAVRAEHVDSRLLRLMRRAGCWMISVGIETGDPGLLARHRSNADLDTVVRCIGLIKAAGIRAKGLFMMGLPGETQQSIERSRRLAFSLPLDDLNMTKFTPFPGSPLYRQVHEFGTFEEDWDRMDCMSFQFVPEGFSRERLERLHSEFYRSHFMRPRVWLHYLKLAADSPDSWRRFLAHAGDYLKFAAGSK